MDPTHIPSLLFVLEEKMKEFEKYVPIRKNLFMKRFWRPDKVDVNNNIHVLTVEKGTKVPRHFRKISEYTESEPEDDYKPQSMKAMHEETFGKEIEVENKILDAQNQDAKAVFEKKQGRPRKR